MLGLAPKYLLLLVEEGALCPFVPQEWAERVEGLSGGRIERPLQPWEVMGRYGCHPHGACNLLGEVVLEFRK